MLLGIYWVSILYEKIIVWPHEEINYKNSSGSQS